AGTRLAGGKAVVGVTATATGSGRVLANILKAIGIGTKAVTRSTAAGIRVVVSQRGEVGKASNATAAAIAKRARLFVNTLLGRWK
ncbi:hypothetical protein ACFLX7_05135, partial [Chloroflexota bacterium]